MIQISFGKNDKIIYQSCSCSTKFIFRKMDIKACNMLIYGGWL